MTLLETALRLLQRPIETTADAPRQRKGGPQPADPVTEVELVAALKALESERQAAEATLANAAEKREMLLLQPGSDDQILNLGREIDRANLLLDRYDRLAPDLQRRLGEVKFHNRNKSWIGDRDAAVPLLTQFVEVIAQYERAYQQWVGIRADLASRWPDVGKILPSLPDLRGSREAFIASLETFRQQIIVLAQPELPLFRSLAGAIAYTKQTGAVPEGIPGEWAAECERAINGTTAVQMLAGGAIDATGRPIHKGDTIVMPYADAQRAVSSGRARYADGAAA